MYNTKKDGIVEIQTLGQLLRDQPGEHVCGTTSGEGHHYPHRFGRIGLRLGLRVADGRCTDHQGSGEMCAMAPICERQASSNRCVQLKASPTLRLTTSAPWLRRIRVSPRPRSWISEACSFSSSTTPW